MTRLRHARLVYKRAPKGARKAALKALRRVVHDELRALLRRGVAA